MKKPTFADRLRTLRESAGLSRYALARASGVPYQYLGRLERGENAAPGYALAAQLADALGAALGRTVSLDEFR